MINDPKRDNNECDSDAEQCIQQGGPMSTFWAITIVSGLLRYKLGHNPRNAKK